MYVVSYAGVWKESGLKTLGLESWLTADRYIKSWA